MILMVMLEREPRNPLEQEQRDSEKLDRLQIVPTRDPTFQAMVIISQIEHCLSTRFIGHDETLDAIDFLRDIEMELNQENQDEQRLLSLIETGNQMVRWWRTEDQIIPRDWRIGENQENTLEYDFLERHAFHYIEVARERMNLLRQDRTIRGDALPLISNGERIINDLQNELFSEPFLPRTTGALIQRLATICRSMRSLLEESRIQHSEALGFFLRAMHVTREQTDEAIELMRRFSLELNSETPDEERLNDLQRQIEEMNTELAGQTQRVYLLDRLEYEDNDQLAPQARSVITELEHYANELGENHSLSRRAQELIDEIETELNRSEILGIVLETLTYQGLDLMIRMARECGEETEGLLRPSQVETGVRYDVERPDTVFRSSIDALEYLRLETPEGEFLSLRDATSEERTLIVDATRNVMGMIGDLGLDPELIERFNRNRPMIIMERNPNDGMQGGYYPRTNLITIDLYLYNSEGEITGSLSQEQVEKTILHEFLHYFSFFGGAQHTRWRYGSGYVNMGVRTHFDEGATEWFTHTRGRPDPSTIISYENEVSVMFYLQHLLHGTREGETGEDVLWRAYISGDYTEVRRQLNNERFANIPTQEGAFERIMTCENGAEALAALFEMMEAAGIEPEVYQSWARESPIMQRINRQVSSREEEPIEEVVMVENEDISMSDAERDRGDE